jgi:hypothetical protein
VFAGILDDLLLKFEFPCAPPMRPWAGRSLQKFRFQFPRPHCDPGRATHSLLPPEKIGFKPVLNRRWLLPGPTLLSNFQSLTRLSGFFVAISLIWSRATLVAIPLRYLPPHCHLRSTAPSDLRVLGIATVTGSCVTTSFEQFEAHAARRVLRTIDSISFAGVQQSP